MSSSRVTQKMTFLPHPYLPQLYALAFFVLLVFHAPVHAADAQNEHHFDIFFSNDVAGEFESCG